MVIRLMLLVAALAGPAAAGEPVLPADPASPAGMEECIALHGEYRVLIDGLAAAAEACHQGHDIYVQGRYSHHFGRGECRRSIVGRCAPLVEQCSTVAEAMETALDRCRKAVRER